MKLGSIISVQMPKLAFKGAKISEDKMTREYVEAISDKQRGALGRSIQKLDTFSDSNRLDVKLAIRPSVNSEIDQKMFSADEYVLTADIGLYDSKFKYRYLESAGTLPSHVSADKAVAAVMKHLIALFPPKNNVLVNNPNVEDFFSKYGDKKH